MVSTRHPGCYDRPTGCSQEFYPHVSALLRRRARPGFLSRRLRSDARGDRDRPEARRRRLRRGGQAARLTHRRGRSRPTSMPTSCRARASWRQAGARTIAGPGAALGFDYHEVRDGERLAVRRPRRSSSFTRPATRRSTSRRRAQSRASRHACSPATRSSSAPSAVPICSAKTQTRAACRRAVRLAVPSTLLTLDDAVEVHPGHGAGSLCGTGIGAGPHSTIGRERRFNPLAAAPVARGIRRRRARRSARDAAVLPADEADQSRRPGRARPCDRRPGSVAALSSEASASSKTVPS